MLNTLEMNSNFNLYGNCYDLLNADKDYFAEAKYISECIKKEFPKAQSILEFGSGTGVCGLFLKEMGYDIFGVELSPQMVNKALNNGFSCKQGDITNFEITRKFDAVIALFHVISYLNDNLSLEKAFLNAAMHLNPKGLFIFDVWYSPAVRFQKPENRIKKVENNETRIIRIAEPKEHINDNIVDVVYTVLVKDKVTDKWEEFTETHSMRHFSIPEISFIARNTGFEVIKAEEFLTKRIPSINTWGVNFILRKNE